MDYLPARMVNELVYCPRLFYLMHVEGQFADSYDTVDGRIVHRRVDAGRGGLDPASGGLGINELGANVSGGGVIPEADLPLGGVPEPEPDPPKRKAKKSKHVQAATLFGAEDGDGDDAAEAETVDEPEDPRAGGPSHARSVTLSCDDLGVIAKMDLIEADGDDVTPVDYKRGRPKEGMDGTPDAWPPEKVQIALQALILRANGYRCDGGVLYFNESRQRVGVPLDEPLVELTRASVARAREVRDAGVIPPPLVDSPKCPRCSLVNLCLPEETRRCGGVPPSEHDEAPEDDPVRNIVAARDGRRPLYLNTQGVHVGKRDDVLIAKHDGKVLEEVRLREINQLNVMGNVQVSTQLVQAASNLDIPIGYYTQKGWFYGMTHSMGVKNILVRREQFRRADDPAFCLDLARELVRGKIRNCRTQLMRNHIDPPPEVVRDLKRDAARAMKVDSLASLLGVEGTAARRYFGAFAGLIKIDYDLVDPSGMSDPRPAFDFRGRNRRPPRDPVNALLSFAYALLTKDCVIAATSVGLDPLLGFYHQVKPGKPALALDLMEPLRPLIADSVVTTAINRQMVTPDHFILAGPSVVLSDTGRKHFLLAYEQRMDTLVTHPEFDYRVSYRRLLEIQTRLLARYLTGETRRYPTFETR